MVKLLVLLLLFCTVKARYPLLRRSDVRRIEETDDEMAISFEGSVAAIQELALQKALADSPTPAPAPDALTCTDENILGLEPLTFDYSVEYEEGKDIAAIMSSLEYNLRALLSYRVLSCNNADAESMAIVGIDPNPVDEPNSEGTFQIKNTVVGSSTPYDMCMALSSIDH